MSEKTFFKSLMRRIPTRKKRMQNRRLNTQFGISLAETTIAIGLMGIFLLMAVELMIKGASYSSTLSGRIEEAPEIQAVITSIQSDLRQGAYISPNSYDQRLEYTTYDPSSGNALKKIFRINSGNLQLSTDGGNTWGSPYPISGSTKYTVSGKFLYAWSDNNCTDFTDTNANGVWNTGEGAAIATCPVGATMSGPDATNPVPSPGSFVTKVDLQNFIFSTQNADYEAGGTVKRVLPSDIFMSVGPSYVRSTITNASPAASDSPLLNSFVTNTANSLFGTTFNVSGLAWDSTRERLILVGGNNNLFVADRDGVLIAPSAGSINPGFLVNNNAAQLSSVALESDTSTVLALDTNASILYRFPLKGLNPLNFVTDTSVSSLTTPKSIAYDGSTPNDFYVVDANGSSWQIEERNILTPTTLDGGPWALPAAFTSSQPPSGLAIDPLTGDFLVVLNYITSNTLTVYRIANSAETLYGTVYSSGNTVATYTFSTTALGSTATTTNGNWGIAYDPDLNRFFLSDNHTDKVYEVSPPSLISSRS